MENDLAPWRTLGAWIRLDSTLTADENLLAVLVRDLDLDSCHLRGTTYVVWAPLADLAAVDFDPHQVIAPDLGHPLTDVKLAYSLAGRDASHRQVTQVLTGLAAAAV